VLPAKKLKCNAVAHLLHRNVKAISEEKKQPILKPFRIVENGQSAALREVRSMGIHLHLPRLASCLFWPIAKSGFNPDFAIDPSAADARQETRRCIPILQAPRNKADAALRTIPRGLRNGLFATLSVFTFLCLFVQITQCPNTMFCRQVRQPGHFSNAKSGFKVGSPAGVVLVQRVVWFTS